MFVRIALIRCFSGWSDLIFSSKKLTNSFRTDSNGNVKSFFSSGVALCGKVNVTFIRKDGKKLPAKGEIGDTLLDVVTNNDIDLDGFGACEGTLTCSTCHLIFKSADYEKLPNKPSEEELDMLDLAFELTDTSRLGCQITLSQEMDGLEVTVPATINDARQCI